MGSITKAAEAIEKLESAAAAMNDVADWLAKKSEADVSAPAKPDATSEKPTRTLEEVRAVLSEKSVNGFTAEVRELIHKYGAEKLSGVDPANYDALIGEAEVLGNYKR